MSAFDDYEDALGSPESVPKAKPGLDWASLELSAQEGFVLSRIDGSASLKDVVSMCGLGDNLTLRIISKLNDDGLIAFTTGKAPAPLRSMTQQARGRRHKAAKDQDRATINEMRAWAKYPFDAGSLSSPADLSEVRKKRILYAYERLDEASYYDLLGVDADAGAVDIRKAYYRQSKSFHPDRYFRRDIGVYREFLGEIFKRLGQAYEVLSYTEGRRKYDLTINHSGDGGALSALEAARERRAKAERTYEVGMSKLKAGVYDLAGDDFRQALELDPGNGTYREMIHRAHKAEQRAIGVAAFREGQQAERDGDIVGAAERYVTAADHHASHAHLARAVETLVESDGNLDKALQFAKLAVQMDSENLDNLLALASVHEARNEVDEAKGALDQATAIAPTDPSVVARLQALEEGE